MTGIRPRGLNLVEFRKAFEVEHNFRGDFADWYGDCLRGVWICDNGHELLPLQIRRMFRKVWKGCCHKCAKEMFYEEQSL